MALASFRRTMMEDVRDVHTKGGRMWLFEALNEARHAARDCGVDEKDTGHGAVHQVWSRQYCTSIVEIIPSGYIYTYICRPFSACIYAHVYMPDEQITPVLDHNVWSYEISTPWVPIALAGGRE